ncbi:MAG: class I SAM-dependent methyltransferase [Actinomycetota bacterium]|nr:class I SAM-dependent methyltransferase [Actinomycetota bacterium]
MELVDSTCPPLDPARGEPNKQTVDFFKASGCRTFAEIGVYKGDTSRKIADHLAGKGEIHLFDFDDNVARVVSGLRAAGHENIVAHGNSRKLMDSYNWSLMRLLREHPEPLFDYVFLDGAHTWGFDALAFLLLDRLLVDGGCMDFDDYWWTAARSPTMNPEVFQATSKLYTEEQIEERQVALVVDLLVRRDPRYEEVVENKIFRKRSP